MTQTRKQSMIEAVTNTGVAFCINLFVMWSILPLFYPGTTFGKSLGIVLIFTVISILRGYVIRRWFNNITPL